METLADPPIQHHAAKQGGLPPGRVLPERAKARLKIAAALLRKRGYHFDGEDFYQEVLNALNALPAADRQGLRDMVDWVEDYNRNEKSQGDGARSTKTSPAF